MDTPRQDGPDRAPAPRRERISTTYPVKPLIYTNYPEHEPKQKPAPQQPQE